MAQTTLDGTSAQSRPSIVDLGAGSLDFDAMYRDAGGDPAKIPWARSGPNPFVEEWLNRDACAALRPGARVVITGCGLGDDVALFADRGYDVLGIEISPTAVEWARHRFPDHAGRFECADLTSLPSRLARRFDLVVEAYTLQAVPFAKRGAIAAGVASLVRPHGAILTVCRTRGEDEAPSPADPPPYPLTEKELCDLLGAHGLSPACDPWVGPAPTDDSLVRMRMVFRRSAV